MYPLPTLFPKNSLSHSNGYQKKISAKKLAEILYFIQKPATK